MTTLRPVDTALSLDGGNGSIDIFGNHVTMVQQAASHDVSIYQGKGHISPL